MDFLAIGDKRIGGLTRHIERFGGLRLQLNRAGECVAQVAEQAKAHWQHVELSQARFAAWYGFGPDRMRNWQQGHHQLGAARAVVVDTAGGQRLCSERCSSYARAGASRARKRGSECTATRRGRIQ